MSGGDVFSLSHGQARALMLALHCPEPKFPSSYVTSEEYALLKEAETILRPAFDGDGSTARSRQVSTMLKITNSNPAHVSASLWVGRTPGARGNSGSLVFRRDEFDELVASGWVDEVVHDFDRRG